MTLQVPCEVYSRVVGYFRPVQMWNGGKQEEYKDRTFYIVNEGQ
jgi:ribonucleoside-triphosphate reductase